MGMQGFSIYKVYKVLKLLRKPEHLCSLSDYKTIVSNGIMPKDDFFRFFLYKQYL